MFDSVKGFWITLKHFFGKPITRYYPQEKRPMPVRFRGVPVFVPDEETGESKCTGCGMCVRVCPSEVIDVERIKKPAPAPAEPTAEGQAAVPAPKPKDEIKYSMDIARCIFCGYCVDSCPTKALAMSQEFELAERNRSDLVYDKEKLLELGRKYVKECEERERSEKETKNVA